MTTGSEIIKKIGSEIVTSFSIEQEPLQSNYRKVYNNFSNGVKEKGRGKGLIIIGGIGIGKTVMMRIMHRLFKDTNSKFRWVNSYELKDLLEEFTVPQIKEMYGTNLRMDLYIDDMGVSGDFNKYGNCINIISELLIERYDLFISHGYKTYVSSNIPLALKDNPNNIPTIETIYGKRVSDRIKEMCELITWNSKSLRK